MRHLENLSLRDYFTIIRRRIWYLIITAILVSSGAAVYIWRLPSIYKSETTIVLANRLLPEDYIRSIDRGTANDRIDSVKQQIQSRSFLARIAQEFQLTPPEASTMEPVLASLRNRTEIVVLSPNSFKLSFTATDPFLAQSLTRSLAEGVIQLNESSRKEKVQVADQFLEEQTREAADQLTQAEEKLWQFRNQRFSGPSQGPASVDDLRSLRAELSALDTRLQTAINQKKSMERRLEERQQLKAVVTSPAPRNPVPTPVIAGGGLPTPLSPLEEKLAKSRADLAALSTRYTSLYPEVARLTQEVEELEAQVAQSRTAAKAIAPTPADDSGERRPGAVFPNLGASADLLQSEMRGELDQAVAEIGKLDQAKKTLEGKIAATESQLNPPPAVAQQLAALNREYESAKQRYNYLSDKKLSSEMATRVDVSADNEVFRIVDEAYLPMFPLSPNRRLLAIAGGLAGLICGLGAAFGREFVDPSLHSEADAAAELNLPILGGVPIIQGSLEARTRLQLRLTAPPLAELVDGTRQFALSHAESKIRDIIRNPLVPAGEPYRLLQAKLSTMKKQRGMKTILITSAIPGEGKTFAAACLAGVLARESGRRVLLIDADLRTGSVSRALGIKEGWAGLNDLLDETRDSGALPDDLAGNYEMPEILSPTSNIEKSIVQCTDLSLDLMPSGTTREKPSHLLNTPQLEMVIRQAEALYDWVIVDSPPVLVLADANFLAPLCDGTIIVVRSGKTSSALVKEAIQRIGTERICGLLMNQIRSQQSSYYYGSYYSRPVEHVKS